MTVVAQEEKSLQQVAVEKLELPARDLTTELYDLGGVHESFTLDRYNATIEYYFSKNNTPKLLTGIVGSSILSELAFPQGPVIKGALDAIMYLLKLNWLVGIPYSAQFNLGINSFSKDQFYINPENIISRRDEIEGKNIIYTLTTRGKNTDTVKDSTKSVLYWLKKVKEKYALNFGAEPWVVTEEDSYTERKGRFKGLENLGAKIFVVPEDYETTNRTKFKARALNYITEERGDLGLNTKNDWIYHQDDETTVGEDTVLGNLDFILSKNGILGTGTILYDLDWKNTILFTKELLRTPDEYRVLMSNKLKGICLGQHGSHFISRADLEDSIGWDFGEIRAEDWLFGTKVLDLYPSSIKIMKGFAHEKAPLSVQDSLRQRRRWLLGNYEIIKRDDVKMKHKLPALYSLAGWYSAAPSLLATVLTPFLSTGGIFPGSGFLAGIYWFSALNSLKVGYQMNKDYLPVKLEKLSDKAKFIGNFIGGIILDSITPWYALIRPTKSYDNIKKDS